MSAGRAWLRHNACSLTGHLNRSIDGVFEIVRVIGRRLVSIAEVHAVVARAHLAQSEPEMARNRFSFLERHGIVGAPLPTGPLLSRFAVRAGFVILRQRFVLRSQNCVGTGCSHRLVSATGSARDRHQRRVVARVMVGLVGAGGCPRPLGLGLFEVHEGTDRPPAPLTRSLPP
jgi:hypothetical protein